MAGLQIVTDGDSRFDLEVGGKSWFFYVLDRLGGLSGNKDFSRGFMERGISPGHIMWEVQEAYQTPVVVDRITRGPLQYPALWKVAQRMTDRPVKFGTVSAQSLNKMVWNEHYPSDKELILELSDIMNEELRELAASGCSLIQIEEPLHHFMALRDETTDEDLEFYTQAVNREIKR